ncbi:uncharacterized protein LOC130051564 [Ostrea edulis]|uniref:uncharacterized protein LOC130051564 n=1 Tax=Ostrea edulis TaxID=37623 RepID=UPI0024AFA00C|nr:uncharacterized protein LOC130051564 [Ostrea edulis]
MVDQFTKWVECKPLPSHTAEVTAAAAVNKFFARFGCPFQVFTDQGRNFESKLFVAICELLQTHKARTTPYRPSANGQVERQGNQHASRPDVPDPTERPPVDMEAYVMDLERATQTAHQMARSRLRTSEERMKRDYDLKEFTFLRPCPRHCHGEGQV